MTDTIALTVLITLTFFCVGFALPAWLHRLSPPRTTPPPPVPRPAPHYEPAWYAAAAWVEGRHGEGVEGPVEVVTAASPAVSQYAWYASDLQTFTGFDGLIRDRVIGVRVCDSGPVPAPESWL